MMARFPKRESEIEMLANRLIEGLTVATDPPSSLGNVRARCPLGYHPIDDSATQIAAGS